MISVLVYVGFCVGLCDLVEMLKLGSTMKPGVVFGPDHHGPATQREFDMQSYPLPRNRVSYYSADDGFIWRLMMVFRF